jgi:hypothetical protein
MAELAYERQASAAGERTERRGAAAAGMVTVVVALVAAAFVAGWRTRRGLGRLTGY